MPCNPEHKSEYSFQLRTSWNIRTDLAIEAREMIVKKPGAEIPGVEMEVVEQEDIKISRVSIETPQAAEQMHKLMGSYITLEVPGLREKNSVLKEKVSQVLSRELGIITGLGQDEDKTVLVIGLGNWNVTPDALGPRVVGRLLVTRHILQLEPETLGHGFRSVAAISPGVLGLTGIETGEIIQGLVEKVSPDLLLVIDALAARSVERLHTTIQITDTGIHPGSGVGNRRFAINSSTIGIPVFALGVPTVVDAVTIAADAMDKIVASFTASVEKESNFYKVLEELDIDGKKKLFSEVLSPYNGNLMVAPKEIDVLIEDTARLIAGSINATLHHAIEAEDASKYLH